MIRRKMASTIKQIHERISGKDYKIALELCKEELKKAEESGNNEKKLKLMELQNNVRAKITRRKIMAYQEKARIEEDYEYNYALAMDYLKQAKKMCDQLFKMGKDHKIIPQKRREIDKKIAVLKKKHQEDENRGIEDNDIEKDSIREENTEIHASLHENDLSLTSSPPKKTISEDAKGEAPIRKGPPKQIERLRPTPRDDYSSKKTQGNIKILEGKSEKQISIEGPPNKIKERIKPRYLKQESFQKERAEEALSNMDISPKPTTLQAERDNLRKERFPLERIKKTKKSIKTYLKERGYFLLNESGILNGMCDGVHILALKIIDLDAYKSIIHIIPLHVCDLKGSLIVEEEKLNYQSFKENRLIDETKQTILIGSNVKNIKKVYAQLLAELYAEGKLLEFLHSYLKRNIQVEKTRFLHKQICLRDGPVEYKMLISPVLVSLQKVGNMEINIPFPLYKNKIDLHIISSTQLEELLLFLKQKQFYIAAYSQENNSFDKILQAKYKLMKNLQNISFPFVGVGAILTILIVLGAFHSTTSILSMALGITSVYIVGAGLLVGRYEYKKRELLNSIFMDKVKIDKSDLFEIAEEFMAKDREDLFRQFLYEIYGKKLDGDILSMLGKQQVKQKQDKKASTQPAPQLNVHAFQSESRRPKKRDAKDTRDIYKEFEMFLEDEE